MRKVGDTSWIDSVVIPNTIHQILFERKLIPNPYFGENEKMLQWIEETDWEIEGPLEINKNTKTVSREITFTRLEPFTEVYINNQFLFESKNAFISYTFEINKLLKSENNRIHFICKSPVMGAKKLEEKNGKLPGGERVYVRKAQYEFGWDWGPRFVTSGVTGNFNLIQYLEDSIYIKDVYIKTESIQTKKAVLKFELEIYSPKNQNQFLIVHPKGYSLRPMLSKKIKLKKGINRINSNLTIEYPVAWHPIDYSKGLDYPTNNFVFKIAEDINKSDSGNFTSIEREFAICKIELIQNKDSIGKSFYIKVNNVPIYIKGFNLIPGMHIDKAKDEFEYYSEIISQLLSLKCNAVRIWGGGEYLSEEALKLFQRMGIIVWQDFMFAGGMYPGDSAFLNNVEEEITYQVKRLRNYNNVALYCGNNEIDEAWHNWGWQKQYNYSKEDSTKTWNDYIKLFHDLIPSIIKKYDSDTDYIPSSPEIGWGRKESMSQGDSHYWGVWWGKEPIEIFEEKIPRFMSEFGMQAMPDLSTLRKVIPDSLMNFDSPEFNNHQKHPTGFETLNYYLEKYLKVPDNLEDYAYATQLLQAITLQKAILAQRFSDKCMGTLIWQLNDTWPVTSWSIYDSDNNPKLAAPYIASSFSNRIYKLQKDSLNFNLYVKDFENEKDFFCVVKIKDFYGNILFEKEIKKSNTNPAQPIFIFTKEMLKNFNLKKCFVKIYNYGTEVQTAPLYFVTINEILFEKPILTFNSRINDYSMVDDRGKQYEINFTCNQELHFINFIDHSLTNRINIMDNFPMDKRMKYFVPDVNEKLPNRIFQIILPFDEFETIEEAEKYVENNFKSLNHLMGK